MTLSILLSLAVSAALAFMTLNALLNAALFPRLGRRRPTGSDAPRVSLLVPARNEAANIGRTVRALLAQDYANLEVIVLDDQSEDGTGAIALAAASAGAAAAGLPLRVLAGQPLPAGWMGKNWACHQLSKAASGDLLVFTDADVRWTPGAVTALVDEMQATRADLLTVWPTQTTVTWGERLVVPLMAMVVYGYLPLSLVHHSPWPVFAAANGQCLAFRRPAYEQTGGHAALRDNILEDVNLARRVKAQGLRLRMADGAGLVSARMYDGWAAVRDGYAKNILAGYGGRTAGLLLAALFHWLVFLGPWFWLIAGAWQSPAMQERYSLFGQPVAQAAVYPAWPLALIGLGLAVRAISAAATGQRVRDALLLPVSVLLMTAIAGRAIRWQWRHGGPSWKGRTYGSLNSGRSAAAGSQQPPEGTAELVEGQT